MRRKGQGTLQTEQLHCAVCRATWPARLGSLDTHRKGHKHRDNLWSDALYGEPSHALAPLRFDSVSLPHHALPTALAHRARTLWALLTSDPTPLVALAGVDCYQRVLDLLAPERLACAGVRLHLTPAADAGAWRVALRSAAGLAYACSLLEQGIRPAELASAVAAGPAPAAGGAGGGAPIGLVELTIGPSRAQRSLEQTFSFSHSLPLLGRALLGGCAPRALSVRLRHFARDADEARGGCTRVLARLLAVLGGALGAPSGLRGTRRIDVWLPAELVRPEHGRLLAAAEEGSWRRRLLAVLLGTHARVGAASPLRALPAPVLELVCARAREAGRTAVSVRPWDAREGEEAGDDERQIAFDEPSGELRFLPPAARPVGVGADLSWMLASGIVS